MANIISHIFTYYDCEGPKNKEILMKTSANS